MSKTLETKDKILNMLKDGKKTPSEISKELGLTRSTVGQHLQELQSMGLVEHVENPYFRKLKYFRAKQGVLKADLQSAPTKKNLRLAIGSLLVVVLALGSIFYFLSSQTQTPTQGSSALAVTSKPGPSTYYTTTINATPSASAAVNCYMIPAYPAKPVVLQYMGRIINSSDCCAVTAMNGWESYGLNGTKNSTIIRQYNITLNSTFNASIRLAQNKCSGVYH